MKVAVTFERVGDIVDALKSACVEKADICLVGWNAREHDGRWPTAFPVEEKLGGEDKLRTLIKKARDAGYRINCHTNASDAYRISPQFDEGNIAKKPDGTLDKNAIWSGGQMYNLCFKQSFDKYHQKRDLDTAALGFDGIHYIDVISTVKPTVCFDASHPLNGRDAAKYANKILSHARGIFGGVGSEGGYDHVAQSLDFALYIIFSLEAEKWNKMVSEYVPLWNLAYNGIIFSNAGTSTVNYPIKSPEIALKVSEYMTHPTFYYYSSFRDDGKNWMGGNLDLRCGSREELEQSAKAVKKGFDFLQKYGRLQLEFFESHNKLADNVYISEFSDGTRIVSNASDSGFYFDGRKVVAKTFEVFERNVSERQK